MNDLRIALSLQRSRTLREGGVCVEVSHATPHSLPSTLDPEGAGGLARVGPVYNVVISFSRFFDVLGHL